MRGLDAISVWMQKGSERVVGSDESELVGLL